MSLYFTLFETICLFVTAFVVNFLVLDGRSNYLEGALLIAAYVIIGYVCLSLFFPLRQTLTPISELPLSSTLAVTSRARLLVRAFTD